MNHERTYSIEYLSTRTQIGRSSCNDHTARAARTKLFFLSHAVFQVYTEALRLWDVKCREVLPISDHKDLCSVRGQ